MFVVLVGVPGTGKSAAITYAEELIKEVKDLFLAPTSVTDASLIDALAKAQRKVTIWTTAQIDIFNAMTVISAEFQNFIPKYEANKMGYLTHLYDGLRFHEARRSRDDDIIVERPNLCMLAGTTPSFLGGFLGDEAWDQGFCSRTIFIFSDKVKEKTIFHDKAEQQMYTDGFIALTRDLKVISKLYGEAIWTKEAANAVQAWNDAGLKPVPQHGRLQNYNSRRLVHVLKLAIIASMARDSVLTVTREDYEQALEWLLEAEDLMPHIFSKLAVTPEARAMQDAMYKVNLLYKGNGKSPVPEHELVRALIQSKVRGTEVMKVADLMVKARMLDIVKDNSTGQIWYVPRA